MRSPSCQIFLYSAVLLCAGTSLGGSQAEAAKTKKKVPRPGDKDKAPVPKVAPTPPLETGGGTRLETVAVTGILGFTLDTVPRPSGPAFTAMVKDNGITGARATRSKLLGFSRDGEPATVLYLEYGSAADAQKALPKLRAKLWGGDQPPPEGPRLLRASNIIAVVEAQTLTVALAVSKGLVAAGAVQDAADPSFSPGQEPGQGPGEDQAGSGTTPDRGPGDLNLDAPTGLSREDQAKVAAGLGRYINASADAGKLLRDKRYADALSAYQGFDKDVSADPAAPELAKWDAASGVGLAAAYTRNMPEAKRAFSRAVKFAAKLDLKKVAETYFNLACAEAELGNKGPAISDLLICLTVAKKVGMAAHYRESIATDPSLKSVAGDPRVKKMVAGK